MESKQRKRLRGMRRILRTLAALGICGALTNAAFADIYYPTSYDSLVTGLSAARDSIQLAPEGDGVTGITLSGNLTVGAGNTVDLAGFSLVQNAQKLNFTSESMNLVFTDSAKTGGSLLDFTGFVASEDSKTGTVTLDALSNAFSGDFAVEGVNLALTNASVISAAGTLTTSNLTASGASSFTAFNLDASDGFALNLSGASGLYIKVDETTTTNEETGESTTVINDAASGTATLGSAANPNAHVVMNITGGSAFAVSASSDSTVGGVLNAFLQDGDSITIDSADSSAQSAVVIGKTTNLTALGAVGMNITNGSYASLGDLNLTVADGNSASFVVDGSGTFTDSEGKTSDASSTLVLNSYNKTGDGSVSFKIQNGGALYVGSDFTLDSQTTLTKDADASAGSLLSVAGKLTLNRDLVVGTGTSADLVTVTANVLNVASVADSTVNLTVRDGSQAQFGQVLGAQGENSTLNITLSGESKFGAFTSEDDKSGDWTGALTLGSTTGGHVNIALSGKSTLVAGTTGSIILQDGDAVSVAGGSQIYGGTALSILANAGNATMEISEASSVYSDGTLYLGANKEGTFKITAVGTDEKNLSYISAKGDVTIGGAGTTNVDVGNYTTVGTETNMVFGDDANGNVNFKIAGDKSYVYVGTSAEEGEGEGEGEGEAEAADDTTGKITIAQHGNVNLQIADSAAVIAKSELIAGENEDAKATIALSNKGVLQSGGTMILGQAGTANVTGSGTVVAAGKLVVGQKANETASSVELTNSYVEAAGLVVGEEADSKGSFSLSGTGSTLHITASDATLASAGDGTVSISGVTSTDYSSCVYMEKGAGIYANGGIAMSNTYLYLGADTVISAAEGGTSFTNGSIVNGYTGGMNATGDVSFKDSKFVMGLGIDGTSNQITINDGSMSVNGSKLELYFTSEGTITGSEWLVAEVVSDDENDKITGVWDIASPLEIYTFEQYITEDGKKQYLTSALKTEYFNVRANSLQLARQSLWNEVNDRISWNTSGQTYVGEKSPLYSYDERSSFWAKAGYRGTDVKGSNGFNTDAFTLSLGADCAFEEYFGAGAFFTFSNPELKEDHETAQAENYSFGLYGGYKTWGDFELKGMFAYTFSDYELNRNMGTAGSAESTFRGSAITASAEIARPFTFGAFILRPLFAVDTECVWQSDAVETGSYAMFYDDSEDTWTYARLGAKFDFAPAQRFTLRGKAFYAIQLDDNDATATIARFNGYSDSMTLVGADVGDNYFNLGLSMNYMFNKSFSAFADYDGYFSDESEAHMVHGGFQVNF